MNWQDEFNYLLNRKILSRGEFEELISQVASIITREVLPLKKQIEEYQTATGWAKVIELEKELERVTREKSIEQGAWEEVKKYQDEIAKLRRQNSGLLDTITAIEMREIIKKREAGMDYLAQSIEEVLKQIEIMQLQLDTIIVRFKKIREEIIAEAIQKGWTKEEIEAKLKEKEK